MKSLHVHRLRVRPSCIRSRWFCWPCSSMHSICLSGSSRTTCQLPGANEPGASGQCAAAEVALLLAVVLGHMPSRTELADMLSHWR